MQFEQPSKVQRYSKAMCGTIENSRLLTRWWWCLAGNKETRLVTDYYQLIMPSISKDCSNTFLERSLIYAAPYEWNKLSEHIRTSNLYCFKTSIKTIVDIFHYVALSPLVFPICLGKNHATDAIIRHSLALRSWLGRPFDMSRSVLPHSARPYASCQTWLTSWLIRATSPPPCVWFNQM